MLTSMFVQVNADQQVGDEQTTDRIFCTMRKEKEPSMNKRKITAGEAEQIGAMLGLDWDQIDVEQFRLGLEVEFEHGAKDPETNVTDDDVVLTGKIAWAHLKEFPDYYTRLARLEAEADTYWASRR
jgi:hypothetical protein